MKAMGVFYINFAISFLFSPLKNIKVTLGILAVNTVNMDTKRRFKTSFFWGPYIYN
jgi:hypothetical protein